MTIVNLVPTAIDDVDDATARLESAATRWRLTSLTLALAAFIAGCMGKLLLALLFVVMFGLADQWCDVLRTRALDRRWSRRRWAPRATA